MICILDDLSQKRAMHNSLSRNDVFSTVRQMQNFVVELKLIKKEVHESCFKKDSVDQKSECGFAIRNRVSNLF